MRPHADHVAQLIQDPKRLALNLEDDTGRLRVELYEVVQLIPSNVVDTRSDFGSLSQILAKDADLAERQVGEERRDIVLDLDDETRLVLVLAVGHLDVVSGLEALADRVGRNLGRRTLEFDRDDVA